MAEHGEIIKRMDDQLTPHWCRSAHMSAEITANEVQRWMTMLADMPPPQVQGGDRQAARPNGVAGNCVGHVFGRGALGARGLVGARHCMRSVVVGRYVGYPQAGRHDGEEVDHQGRRRGRPPRSKASRNAHVRPPERGWLEECRDSDGGGRDGALVSLTMQLIRRC